LPCLAQLDDRLLTNCGLFSARYIKLAEDAAAASPQEGAIWRRAMRCGARWARMCLYAALAAVIAFKSAGPVKELFAHSPWLHTYDDFYLVNAQVGYLTDN
jgi:hypothetical protein